MTKYCVLSYLMGKNYEKTHRILKKTPDTEYILVVDDPLYVDNSGWQVVYDPDLTKIENPFDRCLYVRYHPWDYTDADVVMKIDASVQVCEDLTPIFKAFEDGEYELAVHLHPTRHTAYDELTAWCMQRGMPVEDANKALMFMAQLEGYDVKNFKNLYQLSWSMQKKTRIQESLNLMAYAMNKYAGGATDFRCDQVIFSFVVAKYYNAIKIWVWDQRIMESKFITWYPHNSDTPFAPMSTKDMAPAYHLNKRIQTQREQDL